MNMQKVVGMLIMVMVAILLIPMIERTINPPSPKQTTYTISMTNYNTPNEVDTNDLYNWFIYWYSQENFSHYEVSFGEETIVLNRILITNSGGLKELYLETIGEENIFIFGLNYGPYTNTVNFSNVNISPSYPEDFTFTVIFDI